MYNEFDLIKMKKKFILKWGLVLGCLLGITATIFWLLHDEERSTETNQLLADVRFYTPDLQQDPYFLWLGFEAKTDAEQMTLGQKRYHHDWVMFSQPSRPNIDAQRENFPELQGTFFTEQDEKIFTALIADLNQKVSIAHYQKYQTALQNLYERQTVLNARWQALLNQPTTDKVLLLSPEGAIPNYTLMTKIHRLYVAQLIFKHDVAGLVNYTERLIVKDQGANSLIDNMVMLALISQNIDLIHEFNQKLKTKYTLSALALSQMSMRFPYASETAMVQMITNRLHDQQGYHGLFDYLEEAENGEKSLIKYPIAEFFAPLFLNKNYSLNRYVNYIQPTLKISNLPNPAFKEALQQLHQFEPEFTIKNYMGNKLMDLALPKLETYAVRPRLINQKITLLNILAQHQPIDLIQLNKNQQGDVFYETKDQLCIKTPNPFLNEEEERKYGSCLSK